MPEAVQHPLGQVVTSQTGGLPPPEPPPVAVPPPVDEPPPVALPPPFPPPPAPPPVLPWPPPVGLGRAQLPPPPSIEKHCWRLLHEPQLAPWLPQLSVDTPATQAPTASQHPVQLVALHGALRLVVGPQLGNMAPQMPMTTPTTNARDVRFKDSPRWKKKWRQLTWISRKRQGLLGRPRRDSRGTRSLDCQR